MGWVRRVNLIFLIKGHTKNACDRNFNLLKSQWRHSNVYTMENTFELLNKCENVTAVNAVNLFYDYDKMFDIYDRRPEPGTIVMNHCFEFTKASTKQKGLHQITMTSKEANNSHGHYQQILTKKPKHMTNAIRQLALLYHKPDKIDGTGLVPIKQVDLFTKWRHIVPFQYKDIVCPEPPQHIKEKAEKDRNKNKKSGLLDFIHEPTQNENEKSNSQTENNIDTSNKSKKSKNTTRNKKTSPMRKKLRSYKK